MTARVGDTITTIEQLDALPVGSVVRERDTGPFLGIEIVPGTFEKFPNRLGWHVVAGHGDRTGEIDYPATVLYVPGEQPPSVENTRADGYCTCNGPDAGGRMGDCGIAAHRAEWAASRAVPSDHTATTKIYLDAAGLAALRGDTTDTAAAEGAGGRIAAALEAFRKEQVRTSVPASRQTPWERATSDALIAAQSLAREAAAGLLATARPNTTANCDHEKCADLAVDEHSPCRSTATTEDAARVITAMGGKWSDRTPLSIARALAAAGLLATARPDTTAEWGVRWHSGGELLGVTEEFARQIEAHGGAIPLRRVVTRTAWTEADRG